MEIGVTPRLTPLVSPWMTRLIADPDRVKELVTDYGSPLNVHELEPFDENLAQLRDVLRSLVQRSSVMYACKANKCKSFVKRAVQLGIGITTGSLPEIQTALRLGAEAQSIMFVGAVKPMEALEYCVAHGVPVLLDNYDELEMLSGIAHTFGKAHPVAIRVSGFAVEGQKLSSRFGFDIDLIPALLPLFTKAPVQRLTLQGFHFHLSGYSLVERAAAILQLLPQIREARRLGLPAAFLDIGGGIPLNFLESRSEWETFQHELKRAVLGRRDPITYNNDGLGLSEHEGAIVGTARYYPFYNEIVKDRFLERLLRMPGVGGVPLYQALNDESIELRIEPGRALLDQAGMTLARVAFRKSDARGNSFLGLEINHTQMSSASADFLLDPLLVSSRFTGRGVEVFLVGDYCLEQDLILRRRVSLPDAPNLGDILAFVNTAGYLMHLRESEGHRFGLAKNIFVSSRASGGFDVRLDELVT